MKFLSRVTIGTMLLSLMACGEQQPDSALRLARETDSLSKVVGKVDCVRYFFIGFWYKTMNGSGCGSMKVEANKFPNIKELQREAFTLFKQAPEELAIVSICEFHSKAEYDNFN